MCMCVVCLCTVCVCVWCVCVCVWCVCVCVEGLGLTLPLAVRVALVPSHFPLLLPFFFHPVSVSCLFIFSSPSPLARVDQKPEVQRLLTEPASLPVRTLPAGSGSRLAPLGEWAPALVCLPVPGYKWGNFLLILFRVDFGA